MRNGGQNNLEQCSNFQISINKQSQKYLHHLSMKQGSLFVLFCTNDTQGTRMLQIAFLVSLESSQGGGVHGLGFMAFGLA